MKKKSAGRTKRWLDVLGPGLVTGASDADPSGIGTYAAAGAALGYGGLWTALFTFPLMVNTQYICAKIGIATGKGLSGVLKQHYSKPLLYVAVLFLLIANTINAGADVGAIASGMKLLAPGVPEKAVIVPIGLGLLLLQILCSYHGISRVFKWLTLSLFAYVCAGFLADPDWGQVAFHTVVPSLEWNRGFLTMLVALLGTTISPYLFFWQTDSEAEESEGYKNAFWDVGAGVLFSNVVMFFIMLATGATLHRAGQTQIDTAADAAKALEPFAGSAAPILMGIGLIGTGILAVPVLASSAAYAVAEAMGWPFGLTKKLHEAKAFYGVMAFATLGGLAVNFVGASPVEALYGTAVLNGILAPPLLFIIMRVANDKKIMGKHTNGRVANVIGGVTTLAMFGAEVALLISWLA